MSLSIWEAMLSRCPAELFQGTDAAITQFQFLIDEMISGFIAHVATHSQRTARNLSSCIVIVLGEFPKQQFSSAVPEGNRLLNHRFVRDQGTEKA